jgi:hypothetical protein
MKAIVSIESIKKSDLFQSRQCDGNVSFISMTMGWRAGRRIQQSLKGHRCRVSI